MTGDDNPLRDFLVSRRAAVDPASTGLPATHTPRRVPGLRREEVAALAGVSVAYYIKLEQGKIGQVSEEVIAAIERALQLEDLERRHLRALVHAAGRSRTPDASAFSDVVRPELAAMLHAVEPAPAMVYNGQFEVLATNRIAAALIDDFAALPGNERNLARWTFVNPRAKQVYADWEKTASQVAATLRHHTAQAGTHPALAQLVGEIIMVSPEFARYWAEYTLYEHSYGTKRFRNEVVGEIQLRYENLVLPSDNGQQLVIYSAAPGSPDEEKLRLLASWTTTESPAGQAGRRTAPAD